MDNEAQLPDMEVARGPEQFEVGPVPPTDEVRGELRALLAADESRLGQVYNRLEQGLDADTIAEQLGVATSGFVWNYRRTIRALLDNDLPTAPTVALAAARTFRSFLRKPSLSEAARSYLNKTLDELERRANNVARREDEVQRVSDDTHPDRLGDILMAQNQYLEAEAAYREAVRLDPGNARYQDDLGNTLFAQEKFAEAETAYREAVRLDPGNAVYHNDVGRALFAQRKYAEAEAAQREAVRLEPSREHTYPTSLESEFGVLRLEIDGRWSVNAIVQLFTQLEQAYFAAAALESLAEPQRLDISSTRPQTAEELLQTVVAFRLGGGLQIRSLHYGSAGFVEVIGALNPLKTVKDGITENRGINLKREEARLHDERERLKQSADHEQAMEEEHRQAEQMRLTHEQEMAKIQIDAERTRVQMLLKVIDRLPPEQRTAAAAGLLQMLTRNTESIANEARLSEVRMLEDGGR